MAKKIKGITSNSGNYVAVLRVKGRRGYGINIQSFPLYALLENNEVEPMLLDTDGDICAASEFEDFIGIEDREELKANKRKWLAKANDEDLDGDDSLDMDDDDSEEESEESEDDSEEESEESEDELPKGRAKRT